MSEAPAPRLRPCDRAKAGATRAARPSRPLLRGVLALAVLAAGLHAPRGLAAADGSELQRLPSLGEPDSGDISEGTERRVGEYVMRQIRRDPAYLDDPLLLAYAQALWNPLVRVARARGEIVAETDQAFAWETFLLRDKSINAFALPGGFVGIHLGLIAQAATTDELAAVLAHELTHVTQRHIARSNSSARRQSALGLAGMLLGLLAAARSGSPDLAQATIMGSQAAMAQGQLNFSRDMEREADRIGFTIMTEAGYNGAGVAAIFERLQRANRLNDSGNFPYLRSHPLTVERIGEAQSRVQQAQAQAQSASLGAAGGPVGQTVRITEQRLALDLPSQEMHQLMRARARVLMELQVPALRRWQALAAQDNAVEDRVATLYSATLASLLLGEPRAAQRHLQELQARPLLPSSRPVVDMLSAEVAVAEGQAHRATAQLESLNGRDRAVRLARAEAALKWLQQSTDLRERAKARQALQLHADGLATWVIDRKHDALAWSVLSTCHQALDQPLRAVRAEAEARWALGDLNGALDRFKAGQRLVRSSRTPDYVEASVIDSRLRDLERERRRAFAEIRGMREEDLPPVLPPNVPL
ncbi:MAG: M48 family metalloprotease [Burkholderiales bacterium]|nr:M48 family metalloprotease [Burkholderiales bacterium]